MALLSTARTITEEGGEANLSLKNEQTATEKILYLLEEKHAFNYGGISVRSHCPSCLDPTSVHLGEWNNCERLLVCVSMSHESHKLR